MKFTIPTQILSEMITKGVGVIPSKPIIPVLSHLLIEAANDEIVISSTDLTMGIRTFNEAKIFEEGRITIPAKKLGGLVRELTSHQIEITTNENNVAEIRAETSYFKLHGTSGEEFPTIPSLEEAQIAKISQKKFKDALSPCSFSISKDDNRDALTGVCLNVNNDLITFLSGNGKTLARASAAVISDSQFSGEYILPSKAVDEILKNLRDTDEEIILSFSKDKIALEKGDIFIYTKLLTGPYPPVVRIIPQKCELLLPLQREQLTNLLRQVSLFVPDGSYSAKFHISKEELRLSANAANVGEGNASMAINYVGKPTEIAFNPLFFLDILKQCKGETVTLGLVDRYNPGIITDSHPKDFSIQKSTPLFVLMPMRLEE